MNKKSLLFIWMVLLIFNFISSVTWPLICSCRICLIVPPVTLVTCVWLVGFASKLFGKSAATTSVQLPSIYCCHCSSCVFPLDFINLGINSSHCSLLYLFLWNLMSHLQLVDFFLRCLRIEITSQSCFANMQTPNLNCHCKFCII